MKRILLDGCPAELTFITIRQSMQAMVIKEGKNPRLCYNASTTKKFTDIVMNQVTPFVQEAPITFGRVKIPLHIDIHNRRISYLLAVILLTMGNIKVCF
jgi:hypothetical protein